MLLVERCDLAILKTVIIIIIIIIIFAYRYFRIICAERHYIPYTPVQQAPVPCHDISREWQMH